jgi:hypothetical protein
VTLQNRDSSGTNPMKESSPLVHPDLRAMPRAGVYAPISQALPTNHTKAKSKSIYCDAKYMWLAQVYSSQLLCASHANIAL